MSYSKLDKLNENEVLKLAPYIVAAMHADAKQIEDDAAYNGSIHNNGASAITMMANAYLAGIKRQIPANLVEYANRAYKTLQEEEMRKDPEYREYQRLKAKFGR